MRLFILNIGIFCELLSLQKERKQSLAIFTYDTEGWKCVSLKSFLSFWFWHWWVSWASENSWWIRLDKFPRVKTVTSPPSTPICWLLKLLGVLRALPETLEDVYFTEWSGPICWCHPWPDVHTYLSFLASCGLSHMGRWPRCTLHCTSVSFGLCFVLIKCTLSILTP